MSSAMVLKDEKCPKCNNWLIVERKRLEGTLRVGGFRCYHCGYFRDYDPVDYRIFCENKAVYWKWGNETSEKVDISEEEA